MLKLLIILSFFGVVATGCGNKSVIKNSIESRSLGDGEFITLPLVVPLSDKAISSFESPITGVNPLLRIVAGFMMGIGTSIGAGKQGLTMIQPIPEIPEDYIGSIKIKRILFFIEPTEAMLANDEWWRAIYRRYEYGRENFNFLRRLAVKISSTKYERKHDSWEPVITADSINKKEMSAFTKVFRRARNRNHDNWDKKSTGLYLIKYNQDDPAMYEQSLQKAKNVGVINIIKTRRPQATRKYLEEFYGEYFIRIHTLSRSILVELKKDPIVEEMFKMRLSADAAKVAELGIDEISPCDRTMCLDLNVPDANLLHIFSKGNAIKIETYIDPKRVPKNFQLKGFIEFEVKIKSVL